MVAVAISPDGRKRDQASIPCSTRVSGGGDTGIEQVTSAVRKHLAANEGVTPRTLWAVCGARDSTDARIGSSGTGQQSL